MRIFIDSEFLCHTTNPDGIFREVEAPLLHEEKYLFDGKSDAYIEGYRFIPAGEIWKREDGEVFEGEMVAAWTDFEPLDEAQRQYEHQLLSDYQTENTELKTQQNELVTSYNEGVNSI